MGNRLRYQIDKDADEDKAAREDRLAAPGAPVPADAEFRVICLCAEWCGTCREYRPVFTEVSKAFPEMSFRWLDIEDEADAVGDLDVENFPTLLIARKHWVLYFGAMLPQPGHLRHLLEVFGRQSLADSQEYALFSPSARAWQNDADLQRLCVI